jgi:hypothetical protein
LDIKKGVEMLTEEQKELFQKDKYELVDIIVKLRKNNTIKPKINPLEFTSPPKGTIEKALNKLNKEMNYGNKEENSNKTFKKEDIY